MDYYLLFFINVEARQTVMVPPRAHPTDEWVDQQARNIIIQIEEASKRVTDLIHDWITKVHAA